MYSSHIWKDLSRSILLCIYHPTKKLYILYTVLESGQTYYTSERFRYGLVKQSFCIMQKICRNSLRFEDVETFFNTNMSINVELKFLNILELWSGFRQKLPKTKRDLLAWGHSHQIKCQQKPDPKISPHQTEVIVWHQSKHWTVTLPEINSLPLKFYHPKKQLEFQPSKWQYMCIVWSLQDGWFNDPCQFTTDWEWRDISDLSSSGIRMLWSLQNGWQNGALNVYHHTAGVFNNLQRDSLTLWRGWN